ncbi:patatin-like phospholipase family protein [Sphingomonas sanguinis]|uniref:patatin-like phospholipase family protein n=1 Tax=Sphingomonas sp. LC-1 TaxID=3110957 RepID=UPI0021BB273D|nr:patatin-like phospholipase family protein [Sphingomonas sp. LC-1]MCT8003393.1 patatin-like phospholipase family protein [Sphingomonas sp. LC-1]
MTTLPDCRVTLVLAGGNALGGYQAGVYEALEEGSVSPDWIIGTSAGATNGAILAGNRLADRLDRLRALWRPDRVPSLGYGETFETWRRSGEAMATMLAGRSGMFAPLGSALAVRGEPALYDTAPLGRTLQSLVDFDELNRGEVRFTVQAVTLDTGREVVFDTRRDVIGPDHIRASAAMPPAFPPVAIEGVTYVDGGLSANLPLDPVLADPGDKPLLCIALDLMPLSGSRDRTIGHMIARAQNLAFAAQSQRTIARWQDRYDRDPTLGRHGVTLAHLTYADQQREVAGKAMDFSGLSVRQRWDAGRRDGAELLDRLRKGTIPIGRAGLHVIPIAEGVSS